MFCTIWVHLGSFSCLTKLGAKRAELVQKFVTQSRVGIFRNERTYSTPLDPKLIFWRILYYSGVFGTIVCLMKLGAKWAELVQKVRFHEVASKFFATNAPDPPHCIQNSCFGAFRTIWVHFEQFGLLTKLGAIGPQTHVLVRFILFGSIWDRLVALRNSV